MRNQRKHWLLPFDDISTMRLDIEYRRMQIKEIVVRDFILVSKITYRHDL